MRSRPVVVPSSLWRRADVRDALEAHDASALLRLVVKYAGASQGAVAIALGRTQPEISRYVNGRQRAVSFDVWQSIADGLDMPDAARVLAGLAPRVWASPQSTGDDWQRFAKLLEEPRRTDGRAVEMLRATLAEQRNAEDVVGARRMLRPVLANAELVRELARDSREDVRGELVELMSHYAQFLGWLHVDIGDPSSAVYWYDRAMESAQEMGDANMVVSVLSLKSHQAWGVKEPTRGLALAQAGRSDRLASAPGVRALIAQQEARCHAMLGDAGECDRKLDEAVVLSAEAYQRPDIEPPWTYFQTPERLSMQRATAYIELGRPTAAIELMERGLAALPEHYRRDRGWNLGRLALAYAMAGETEPACVNGVEALNLAAETGSVHPVRELRRMRRLLDNSERHPAVRAFDDALQGWLERGRDTSCPPLRTRITGAT